jgi:hypothetical protein
VSSCGKGLCATIASTKSRSDPATGESWTDKNNFDPGKRNRPLVGVEVLSSMMRLRTTGMGAAYGFGGLGKILGPLGRSLIVGASDIITPKATLEAIGPAFTYFVC